MFERIKATLRRLGKHEPGERFGAFHREQRDKPFWAKAAFFGLAFVAFGVGVVLAFIPGPAVLFFFLSGALLSTQSRFVAEKLDKTEVWGRKAFASMRAWWRRKRGKRDATPRKTGHARG
jgi:hypothetical protein